MPNTRDTLYRRMRRRIRTSAARVGGGFTKEGGRGGATNKGKAGHEELANWSKDKTYIPDNENIGPNRQIINRMPTKLQRNIRKIKEVNKKIILVGKRLVATVWQLRPWREKTAIEMAHELEIKEREKMRRRLRNEGRIFAKRASNAYARMGLCYYPPMTQRSFINGIKKVKFTHIVAEQNAIWLQIDTVHLPHGVSILSLVDDENILTNVSSSLQHHVEGVYDVERGAWLCIERGRGVRGIPQLVTYSKMMELMPKKSHGLTIPLGETVNSKRIYRNFRDFPHLLVAGSTGQGKTSYLNVILAAIIERNTPAQVKIVLVDLKNGIEFDIYRGVPHLWKMGGKDKPESEQIAPDGIVGRADKVVMLLKRLRREGERRLQVFKNMKVTNIDEYNKGRTKSRMDRIVIMIDEWARVALGPEGREADRVLSDITATYRAVGFHVILATQMPIRTVISGLIKTNFNAKLAFGVPGNTQSMVILDSGRAKGLSPVGRSIFQFGSQVTESQVPYITRAELTAILDESRADGGAVEDELSMLDVFRYSLNQLDGSLTLERLHQHYSGKIGQRALEYKLKGMDDLLVDIDGVEYVISPPYGSVPRQLKLYKSEGDKEPIPPPVPA